MDFDENKVSDVFGVVSSDSVDKVQDTVCVSVR